MQIPSETAESATPATIVWEPTRACDLSCRHCRAALQPGRSRFELSTYEGYKVVDQVAALQPRRFVITGGDPLKRPDLFEYIDYARRRGIETTLAPGATPLLTHEAIRMMRDAGLARFAINVDGPDAHAHDAYRGIAGLFDAALDAAALARDLGMAVDINSAIGKHNHRQIASMANVPARLGAATWNLFFHVPLGRGESEEMLTPEEVENVFAALHGLGRSAPFEIATIEGQHYRRYALQQEAAERGIPVEMLLHERPRPENGTLFISHIGEVCPSGFLPLSGGNVRNRPLAQIYQSSPLFVGLRDGSLLRGRCGSCEFRDLCGGSRARAYAMSGDVLGEEPLCAWNPAGGRAA